MTQAPPELMRARRIMIDELDMDPGDRPEDLEPEEVGIVGGPTHFGGYHCGEDRVDRNRSGEITDYSVVESIRDRRGLSIYAAGIDIGWFQHTINGRIHNLRTFSAWLVAECERGASDTLDIREVIYSLDGINVKRWDRLKKRTTGDKSHLTHTHLSEHRDARGRNMPRLFTRYLTSIGLKDMNQDDKLEPEYNTGNPNRTIGHVFADMENLRNWMMSAPGAATINPPPPGSVGAIILDAAMKGAPVAVVDVAVLTAAVNTAVNAALADPTVLANIARAVNDDAARRAAE